MKPFPLDSLPEPLRIFVEEQSRALRVDPAAIAPPLLATMGTMIGTTRAVLPVQGWIEFPLLWVVTVAASGSKKSQALRVATEGLQRFQETLYHRWQDEMHQWEEEQIAPPEKPRKVGKKAPPPEPPPAPKLRHCITRDTTMEKAAEMMADSPRGLLCVQDELSGWFACLNQYRGGRGGDREAYLSIYSATPIKIDRVMRGTTFIKTPFLSIVGCATPESLRRALQAGGNDENGVSARFLIIAPPERESRWSKDSASSESRERLNQLADDLLALDWKRTDEGTSPVFLPLTSGAERLWERWYNRHQAERHEQHGPLKAFWAKVEAIALRLALIIQLCDSPEARAVADRNMERALDLADWFKTEAIRWWENGEDAREADRLNSVALWIRAKHGGRISPRLLISSGPRPRPKTVEEAEQLLARLEREGRGRFQIEPTQGRPATEFVLSEDPQSAGSGSAKFPEESDLPLPDSEEIPF